jgi:putative ABC transport system permease protein
METGRKSKMPQILTLPGYLAIKEVWRNRGRFLLISLVIALITLLVLFIAALGEGLGNGNREYLSKLDAQLIVYQAKSDNLIPSSRLSRERVAAIRRVPGVADAGPLSASNANLIFQSKTGAEALKVALLGIEPGHTGEPPVLQGRQLNSNLSQEVILDRNTALRTGFKVGDTVTVRVTQGTKDEFYELNVVGLTDGRQYGLQPTIFVPFLIWDKIRPKSEAEINNSNPVANVILVRLKEGVPVETASQQIISQVNNVDVATIQTAIEALPGYSAQQSTLNTQGGFTLFIGVLVIGGFFQIQILQKVPQIGVLKAIGASNWVVALSAVLQIIIVTVTGVAIGGLLTFLFSLSFPPTIPIVFNGTNSAIAVAALLLIGPAGGLVSIRYAVRIEPLKALGLSS